MQVRLAVPSDLKGIVALNEKFHEYYRSRQLTHGFLTNKLSHSDVNSLVENSAAIVLAHGDSIKGYYVTSDVLPYLVVDQRKNIVDHLIHCGNMPHGTYAYFTQAAVDDAYMNKGYGKQMLTELIRAVNGKFDYLIGWVSTQNSHAKNAHERSGWRLFHENADGNLLFIPTKMDR